MAGGIEEVRKRLDRLGGAPSGIDAVRQRLDAIETPPEQPIQPIQSVTGDFGPMPRQPAPNFGTPSLGAFAPPPTPEQVVDYRRGLALQPALEQIGQRDPAAVERFKASQEQPVGPQIGTGERIAVDFLKMAAPTTIEPVARLGRYIGIPGLDDAADTSSLGALSASNPSRSGLETAARSGATLAGFALPFVSPVKNVPALSPLVQTAGIGSRLGAAGGYLGKLSGGLAGLTAPTAALDYAEGKTSLGESLTNTLGAGPTFLGDIPGMAYRTGESLVEGEPIRAAEEASPLAMLALPHVMGRRGGKALDERPVEFKNQPQPEPSRIIDERPVEFAKVETPAPEAPAPVAERRTAAEPEGAKPKPERTMTGLLRGDVDLPIIGQVGPEMYAQNLTNTVKRQGGEYGRAIANRATKAIDLADRIAGSQSNRILEAEDLIRRSPTRAVVSTKDAKIADAAYEELAKPVWNENVPSAGFSGLQDAIENGSKLSERAGKFAKEYDGVVRRTFRIGQRLGTEMKSLAGEMVNTGGRTFKKFIRVYTQDARQIWEQKGKIYREFVDTLSKLNGITFEKAEQAMEQIFNRQVERTISIEKARAIKTMPTYFKDSTGKVWQIMEADPIKALQGAVRNSADKIALNAKFGPGASQVGISPSASRSLAEYRKVFAADKRLTPAEFNKVVKTLRRANQSDNNEVGRKLMIDAKDLFTRRGGTPDEFQKIASEVSRGLMRRGNRIQQLRVKFAEKGGNIADYDNLIKALSNRPVVQPESSRNTTGSPIKDAVRRVLHGVEHGYRSLLLTGAAGTQVLETVGGTVPLVGLRAAAKALARLRTPDRIVKERELLRDMGAITTELMNLKLNEGTKVEDFVRNASKIVRTASGFDPINELNETVGATMGRAFSERIAKGKLSATDRARLSALGYEQRQINRFSDGKATRAEISGIVRRVSKLQGTTLRKADQSRFANDYRWRAFAPFQNYFQNVLRVTDRVGTSAAEAVRSGDPKRILASARVVGEYLTGRAIQGWGTLYVLSLIAGRDPDRTDEGYAEWMGKNLGSAMVGGVVKSTIDAVGNVAAGPNVPFAQTANDFMQNVSAPYRQLGTVADAISGAGKYQGMSQGERAAELLRGSIPFTRYQKMFLAASGQQDPKMEAAISSYWDWFFKNNPSIARSAKPENAAFNSKIKGAVKLLRNGRIDEAQDAIQEALASDLTRGPEDVRTRIQSKKMLYRLNEQQIEDLKKSVGEKKFKTLQAYDSLLDNFSLDSPSAGDFMRRYSNLNRKKKAGTLSDDETSALRFMDKMKRKAQKYRGLLESSESNQDSYRDVIDQYYKIGIEDYDSRFAPKETNP